MVTPSIIFYAVFGIPYFFVIYRLLKQDKKKYAWGMIVLAVIGVAGVVVSQKASRIAIENYKQHEKEAKEQNLILEQERKDSTNASDSLHLDSLRH